MRNKVFHINGKRGIVKSGQYCNGPLQNWGLNAHFLYETFRTQRMKRIRVQV
jgi:hypothetical protein